MTLTFVCQSCDDSFEVELSQLAEGRVLKCPGCSKRVPAAEMEELSTTLDDLLSQIAALKKRFAISFEIDADDLPPQYDTGAKRASPADEDEDEDEDELGEDEEELGEDEDEDERF